VPDVGAVELNEVVMQYTGLICFGETNWDQGSASDEPYVVLGTVSHQGPTAARSQIYEHVNAIQGRADMIEIYRGKPYGIALTARMMEHDEDDPDRTRQQWRRQSAQPRPRSRPRSVQSRHRLPH